MADNNLELFYDVLDESVNIIYEQTHEKYFDMLLKTFKNVIACDVLDDFDAEATNKLMSLYEKLSDVDFSVEEVRKAIQAIILKGFKEMRMSNIATPDTLGYLVAYLISRLIPDKNMNLNILDPLCGTGNLLFSLVNHLQYDMVSLFGIDHNEMMINLCNASADLLDTHIELYLQDALNVNIKDMNLVVFDSPVCVETENGYFLYDLILKYSESLKDKGYMIGIIPDDFFDYDKEANFKKRLLETMTIMGIIELPSDFFISQFKSILILKKEVVADKKCLMVKLPSFSNVKEFNNSLLKIEKWFEINNKM